MNSPLAAPHSSTRSSHVPSDAYDSVEADSSIVDWADFFARLRRGLPTIALFAIVGVVLGLLAAYVDQRGQPASTSARVVFSFPGFEKGEYPDHSKFQPEDLRRPEIVRAALKKQGMTDSAENVYRVRGALSLQGLVPNRIVESRDRARAAGQPTPFYIPDEYRISFAPRADLHLTAEQRQGLLGAVIAEYHANFRQTYGEMPAAFGHALEALSAADYSEYQLILETEVRNITAYLSEEAESARSFRSSSTGFSFKDLVEQTELFSRIQLNEVLGLVHQYGLSRDRTVAMLKMDNQLRLLADRERRAIDEEAVVRDLLTQAQSRGQRYAMSIAGEAARAGNETPLLSQNTVESLLANDANNFLVRKALEAGLRVKQVQAEIREARELRDNMKSFVEADQANRTVIAEQVDRSMKELETNYKKLVDNIRRTHADFSEQQFGKAIRVSQPPTTASLWRGFAIAAVIGGFLGWAFGTGLSCLGVYVGKSR